MQPTDTALSFPAVMVIVVTAAGFVVCVPVFVSAGLKVTVAVALHAMGNTGDEAPVRRAGAPKRAKLVTGNNVANAPSRILLCPRMTPPLGRPGAPNAGNLASR